MNKYRNVKTIVDGIKFDSKKEAKRYNELKLLEKCGKISGLKTQEVFNFVAEWDFPDGVCKFLKYKSGRDVTYRADFVYHDHERNCLVVEDVKSKATMTPSFKIKWALMKHINGIEVLET
jgi:hypothetical protein